MRHGNFSLLRNPRTCTRATSIPRLTCWSRSRYPISACGSCHSPEKVVTQGQSREDWEATLAKMAAFGMSATDDELSEILDYLAKNFPKPQNTKSM